MINRIIGEDGVSVSNELTCMKPNDVFEMYNTNNKKDRIIMQSGYVAYKILQESSGPAAKKSRNIPDKKESNPYSLGSRSKKSDHALMLEC